MSELNEKVFGNHLILSNILSSLTLRQLTKSCLLVNKFWYRITQTVIRDRTEVKNYFELCRTGNQHKTVKSVKSLFRELHLLDSKPFISYCLEELETKLIEKVNEMFIKPYLVLTFFGNYCPYYKRWQHFMQYKIFRQYFPPETQFLNVVSNLGLIGSVYNDRTLIPIETQAKVGNCVGISELIFPKYQNIEIDVIDEQNTSVLEKLRTRNDLKCVVIMCTTCADDRHHYKEFLIINELRDKYEKKIAIGGILIDKINYFSSNLNSTRKVRNHFFGIAFSGEKVNACSLHYNTITPETTEQKFLEFKENLKFKSNLEKYETIAFMFVCTARGIHTEGYTSSNTEPNIFRKVFPGVRLVGLFGQGEYGHNYWPSITREQQLCSSKEIEKSNCNPHELWHFNSSVLVIINLPKK